MCPDFFYLYIFLSPHFGVEGGGGGGGGWLITREQSTAYVQYILKIISIKLLFIIIYIMIWLIYLDIKRETFFE